MGYFFAYHFFPYTKQNINSKETQRGSCEGGQGKPILVPKCKKVFFPLDSIKIQTMKIGKKNGLLIFLYSLIQSRTKTLHGQARRLRIVVYMIISTFLHTSPFSTTSARSRPPKPIKWRRNSLNNARYKKAVSTALWIQMILFACYLPFFVLFCFFLLSLLVYLFRCMEHAVLHSCVMLRSLILDRKMFSHFYCWICYERDRWKI